MRFDTREWEGEQKGQGGSKQVTRCLLCGRTYEQHLDRPNTRATPRVGCSLLKENFIPDERS